MAWSKNMEWPGKKGYGEASVDPWYNKATLKEAGEVRSYNNLTFLRVFDAGHMVRNTRNNSVKSHYTHLFY